ncbi:Uncharacterised protein [Mycobacteroides abscessus subsp. abscessus]|nr:Uncharacterised protein [Mycobacteroides abscessus subsp. abscessus]
MNSRVRRKSKLASVVRQLFTRKQICKLWEGANSIMVTSLRTQGRQLIFNIVDNRLLISTSR